MYPERVHESVVTKEIPDTEFITLEFIPSEFITLDIFDIDET